MKLGLCIVISSTLLASCRTTKKADPSDLKDTSSSVAGLDVNDVSILFPMPTKPTQIEKLLPINFSNADGKMPVSETLFKDVLAHQKYEITFDGKKTILNSGSRFDGLDRNGGGGRTFGPYDRIEDWKIVAMRFDPCAPTPAFNHKGRPPTPLRTDVKPSECLQQIRLTAQPVLPVERDLDTFRFGLEKRAVVVADYAIHLIFSLSAEESEALYGELQKFKKDCGDVTTSVPLTVHPCLSIESKQGASGGQRFAQASDIAKRYAKKLTGLAMLATVSGDDPWVFMNGLVEGDSFKHMVIEAVKQNDPNKLRRGSAGNILEPFSNGFFQQLNFIKLGARGTNADRVAPAAIPENVNVFLKDELNGITAPVAEVVKKYNSLENPLANDFFSTDCVSCHVASDSFIQHSDNKLLQARRRGARSSRAPAHWTPFDSKDFYKIADHPIELRPGDSGFFRIDGGYTNIVTRQTQTSNTRTLDPIALIHFGYLSSRPTVSPRAANESALVAALSNKVYNKGVDPQLTCPTEELRQCLANPMVSNLRIVPEEETALSYCMRIVCPKRAKELQPLFGDKSIKAYRVTRDLPIVDFTGEPGTFILKKGTMIYGTLTIEEHMPPEAMRFTQYNMIEVQAADGKPVYLANHHLTFNTDPDWIKALEVVEL